MINVVRTHLIFTHRVNVKGPSKFAKKHLSLKPLKTSYLTHISLPNILFKSIIFLVAMLSKQFKTSRNIDSRSTKYFNWIPSTQALIKKYIKITKKYPCIILKFSNAVKIENFTRKNDIFNIFTQNIDRGYTLELPRRGGSSEYGSTIYFLNQK